jgi:hypothetical protein
MIVTTAELSKHASGLLHPALPLCQKPLTLHASRIPMKTNRLLTLLSTMLLCVVTAFFLNGCGTKSDSSTPESAVKAFYHAVATNNTKEATR